MDKKRDLGIWNQLELQREHQPIPVEIVLGSHDAKLDARGFIWENGKLHHESRWNSEVTLKLRALSSRFLALDGHIPMPVFKVGDIVNDKIFREAFPNAPQYPTYSSSFPGLAGELSNDDEIFYFLTDNYQINTNGKVQMKDFPFPTGREMGWHRFSSEQIQIVTLLLGLRLLINVIHDSNSDRNISRRTFLNLFKPIPLVWTLLSSGSLSALIREGISASQTMQIQNLVAGIFQKIHENDMLAGVFNDANWWVDGRTALSYSKLQAGVEELESSGRVTRRPDEKAAAVFGYEHASYDDSKRVQYIETYFLNVRKLIDAAVISEISDAQKKELYWSYIKDVARWQVQSLKRDQDFFLIETGGFDTNIVNIARKVFEIDTLIS